MTNLPLKPEDIKVGSWYEAKKLRCILQSRPNNDRKVLWIGTPGTSGIQSVQYDSDTVKQGQHRPIVSMEKFLKWAKREICEEEHDSRFIFKKIMGK